MAKRFITPFAEAGDRAEMPDVPTGSDSNYQTGYPSQYEEDPVVNPSTAKFVERDKSNQLYNDITSNIKEWQEQTYPAFITSAVNGGIPFSYKQGSIVKSASDNYVSLADNNEDVPPSAKWKLYNPQANNVLNFDDLPTLLSSTKVLNGDSANLSGRNSKDDGGGTVWHIYPTGTFAVGATIFDVFEHDTLPLQVKMRLDKNITPEMFGCLGSSDTSLNLIAYQGAIVSLKASYKEPISSLNTVNLINPNIAFEDRKRVNSTGLKTLRELFSDPSKGIHFIGDSVANGFSTSGQIPGDARHSYAWPNIVAYAIRRNKSGLSRHDKTFNAVKGGASGSFTNIAIGAMDDYDGFLDASVVAGSGGLSVNYIELTKPIEFTLPLGGKCTIPAIKAATWNPLVNVTISLNGGAFFSPTSGDNFQIEGFSNPAQLDFTAAKNQLYNLNFSYAEGVVVIVKMESTDAQRLFFNLGATRTDTAYIYTPNTRDITKNPFDVYAPSSKVCALSSVGSYNTMTIAYLAGENQNDVLVKFQMNDNTIVDPSSIAGLGYLDTLGAGGTGDLDTIVTDTLAIGHTGNEKYITRSYIMTDKSDLSLQGVVGVILYSTIGNVLIHDISFHGIVNNEGVSGETTAGYLSNEILRITPYLKLDDIVVICTGINDWQSQEASIYDIQKRNYRNLALAVMASGGRVVFMTNTQVQFDLVVEAQKDNRNLRFQDIQQAMVDAANEMGCDVIDWNAYNQELAVIDWNGSYMADNLHPNGDGHKLIANWMIKMAGLPEYES